MSAENNVVWQETAIKEEERAHLKKQTSFCIWLTGLSGAGKTTLANMLEQELFARGMHTFILDGDNIRHGLNTDLGFTDKDRTENIRRVAEVSKLFVEAGVISIVSFISPFQKDRLLAKNIISSEKFLEIFVDTSIGVCEQRDVKGLYRKARLGIIRNFTGIDSEYQRPEDPDLRVDSENTTSGDCVEKIIDFLVSKRLIK